MVSWSALKAITSENEGMIFSKVRFVIWGIAPNVFRCIEAILGTASGSGRQAERVPKLDLEWEYKGSLLPEEG